MKYMGDYPSKKQRLGTELTDQIFECALVHVSHPSVLLTLTLTPSHPHTLTPSHPHTGDTQRRDLLSDSEAAD